VQVETDKINILMVDDNATNLLALETILEAPDRNLVKASSGDEALRYLLDTDVAVILLDVYMPGIDGLETAALIRGREKSRDIPIIFITADSTGNRHIAKGYSLGAVDYILKPVEPDILRSKVAVFVELFKKTEEIKRQAELLHEKNLELENANLQRLGMLIELGQRLAAEHDPARLLEQFCHAARDIVGAAHAGVGVRNGGAGESKLRYFFRSDQSPVEGAGEVPAADEGLLGALLKDRQPIRLADLDAAPHATRLPVPHGDARSFLGAPIFSASRAFGWLYLTGKLDAEEFSEADERLAVTLATQVSVAYENARLYTEAQRHAAALQQEIAERRQAEEARARMLVREQAARAEAELANRTKDEFLATLSHELRTPLTAILGWSHLLRSGKFDQEGVLRGLETIERNARSQSQLIDDLLDVSRIITGKLSLDVRPVDLVTVVGAVIESMRPAADAKGIKFAVELDPSAARISGDASRLQQVVWNLLSNAVKFTPEGGRVETRLERAGAGARLTVSDTGQGIAPQFLPHVFERFRQADGTTTRQHGGLGLGLAIARHLVELHGGTIEARSDGVNKGTTFTVTLPSASPAREPAARREIAPPDAPDRQPPRRAPVLDGLRILIVDDEPDTRDMITEVLARCGAVVKSCGSAAEALPVLAEGGADLLVSDIGMPEMDGYAFIKKVRQMGRRRGGAIPAVALTAYASPQDREQAISAGFHRHLAKPLDPEELIAVVASVSGRDVRQEAGGST
jgi:signal transduction histidine kinase/response regulator RpfG family c-di-GMP phosphodiesterase